MRLGTIQRISIREVAEDLFIKHTQSGGEFRITKEAEDGAGFLLQSSSSQNSSVDKSVE